jgi:NAD(P)-dependent dehydrogenase (short-subunit alcohol dehydrogenase family)
MTDQTSGPSRRDMFRAAAAASAVAAAAPAFAQGQQDQPEKHAPGAPTSPLAANYAKPPLPEQRQPWPALQSKMTPVPDCGETSYKGSGRLAGRKALVTGGDSGIGRAAAIAFAREGADVAINYYPTEEPDAREVKALIEQAGRKAVLIPADIRTQSACAKIVADAVRGLGGLDILVNNAARQQNVDSILDLTTEQFDWTLKTNLYAMFWITKAAVPHLKPGSCIINTASVQAYDPSPNLLDYAQTKAAQVAFTKALAKQLAEKGIRVNAIAPGPVWTPLQVTGGQKPEALDSFGEDVAMKRPGQPAELASAYVTLASDEASYTTAHVYGIAGGKAQP